jgi:hypothetical protein
VGPVPDPLLLRKSGSARNRTRTYGSVTTNSDHYTTDAVVGLRIKAVKDKKSDIFWDVTPCTPEESTDVSEKCIDSFRPKNKTKKQIAEMQAVSKVLACRLRISGSIFAYKLLQKRR